MNSGPPPNLRALAARELATSGRYHLTAPRAVTPHVSLLDVAWSWLRDRWSDLWHATFGRAHLNRSEAVVIGDVLVAAVALVVVIVAVRMFVTLSLERRARAASARPLAPDADAAALYAAACECAARGEYVRATQALFAATIATLASRGLVRDDRSATVGEFRRELRDVDAVRRWFDDVSSAFVAGAYAQRPIEPSQWERARQAYVSLAAPGRP